MLTYPCRSRTCKFRKICLLHSSKDIWPSSSCNNFCEKRNFFFFFRSKPVLGFQTFFFTLTKFVVSIMEALICAAWSACSRLESRSQNCSSEMNWYLLVMYISILSMTTYLDMEEFWTLSTQLNCQHLYKVAPSQSFAWSWQIVSPCPTFDGKLVPWIY